MRENGDLKKGDMCYLVMVEIEQKQLHQQRMMYVVVWCRFSLGIR